MSIIKHIPNIITLANLICGTIATIFAVKENFKMVALFVFAGILFDFLDGFIARLLGVSNKLGEQLDALADMVTSGVVPGIIMFQMLGNKNENSTYSEIKSTLLLDLKFETVSLIGLFLTLGACYRLAKFNIDKNQSKAFIGLPTPAMCLFIISLPLIKTDTEVAFIRNLISNTWFLVGISVLLSFLMNSKIKLFSLKFNDYSIKNNKIKYLFLLISIISIICLKYLSIPIIIILYILLSLTAYKKISGNKNYIKFKKKTLN